MEATGQGSDHRLKRAPAHPKVAPPSRHNASVAGLQAQKKRQSALCSFELTGGQNPDSGFCRCECRLAHRLVGVNMQHSEVMSNNQ